MEHSQAVSILEAVVKDSKVFQGILVGQDCLPIMDRRVNLAKYLIGIADALVDTPRQTDLFSDAPRAEEKPKLVECPACHHQQADGGPGSFCIECGVGPMPTNFPLTAKACLQALNAVVDEDDQFDFDEVNTWTAAELQSAMEWAKHMSLLEGDLEEPPMPLHIKEWIASMDFTAQEVQDALKVHIETPIPLDTIGLWNESQRLEAVSWMLHARRDPMSNEAPPAFVAEAWEAISANIVDAAMSAADAKSDEAKAVSPEDCLSAINEVLEKSFPSAMSLDLEEIELWTFWELKSAFAWCKAWQAAEGTNEKPQPPIHLAYELDDQFTITSEQLAEAVARVNDPLEPSAFASWTLYDVMETAYWAILKGRNSAFQPVMPRCLLNAYEAKNAAKLADETSAGNPFGNWVDVDSRLRQVKDHFTADDCAAALAHDDKIHYLQKTVRKAVETKLRGFKKAEATA